jgi:hypothetical protein
MGKHIPRDNVMGSQRDLQQLIENRPGLLNSRIKTSLGLSEQLEIEWVSPIPPDYAEYSDDDFLRILDLDPNRIRLNEFWPNGGPHWDALGKGNDGSIFLVEAKAHISEMVSSPSGAGEDSLNKIRGELERTKAFLHAKANVDWTTYFFQYANRLAHLQFLRFDNKLSAFLVFIYFIGDQDVKGPSTKEEWLGAIELVHSFLGIGRTKLTPFITDVFVHVDEFKGKGSGVQG